MRAVLCVDVEPDRRESEVPGPAAWEGAELLLTSPELLRDGFGADGGAINWFMRIDPQVAGSHGDERWAARHFRRRMGELVDGGDEVGLHPHNWKWIGDRWCADGSDDWVLEVTARGLSQFADVFEAPCRTFRYGDRFVSQAVVNLLIADPDVVVDLTLEPGTPTMRGLAASEVSTGLNRHVDPRRGNRYQPSMDAFDIPSTPDGTLTMVPLTTAAIPGEPGIDALQLWRPPEQFEAMLRLRMLDSGIDHLAFAIRSDLVLLPWAFDHVCANLRLLSRTLQLDWVRSTDLVLGAGDGLEQGLGLTGSIAAELDRVVRSLDLATDRMAMGVIAAEVDNLRAEVPGLRAALEAARSERDVALDQVAALQHQLGAAQIERTAMEATLTWRVREDLLPLLRPVVGRVRGQFSQTS